MLSLSWALNWLGLILICEHITYRLKRKSLLKTVRLSRSNTINFIVASVLGGALIEGIGQWLAKLWYWPYFSLPDYLAIFIPGFALYMLMVGECYLAMKAIFDTIITPRKISIKYYPFERKLYRVLAAMGTVAIILGLVLLFHDYPGRYVFNINSPNALHVTFLGVIMIAFGVWWCCEYIEYRHREMSFMKDIIRAYWNPLLAIVFATIIVGISSELINLRHGYWVYVNWPLQHTRFLGLPIIMLTVAWPLQFIMFLSLLRAITAKDSVDVWSVPIKNIHRVHR